MAEPSEQTPPVDSVAQADDTPKASDTASIDPSHDDDIKSKKVSLADLSAKGTALYAHRNYEEAAEVFSRASILQAEINGETAPENAEILFHYGRSLFKVGQSKSDVLGGSAPTTDKKGAKANGQSKGPKPAKPAQTEEEKVTEEKEGEKKAQGGDKTDATANKPLFQFTGDENFDESDEDDGEVNSSCSAYPTGTWIMLTLLLRAPMKRSKKRKTMILPLPSRFLISPASAMRSSSSSPTNKSRMGRARK